MLNVTIDNNCELISLETPDDNYIEHLNNPSTTDCCAVLVAARNCCPEDEHTFYLRHNYNLVISVSDCEEVVDGGTTYHDITFEITGIDSTCLSSLTIPTTPGNSITVENPGELEYTFRYQSSDVGPSTVFQHEVAVRTCDDNLAYSLTYSFNPNGFTDPCDYVYSGAAVAYPALPHGVTINGTVLEIDTSLFGDSSSVFSDGVYYFSLSENNIPLTNTVFVDCNTQCQVINYVSNNTCSNLYSLYEALNYSQECDTITYEQMCQLWYFIGSKLGYFTSTPCGETSDCGCT